MNKEHTKIIEERIKKGNDAAFEEIVKMYGAKFNKDLAVKTVKRNGLMLEHLAAEFKGDKKIATEAVKQNVEAYSFVDNKLKADIKFLKELVKVSPGFIEKDEDLSKNKEIMLELIRVNAEAIKYSSSFKGDENFIKDIAKEKPEVFQYLEKNKKNKELVNDLLNDYPKIADYCEFINEEGKFDKDQFEKFIEKNWKNLKYFKNIDSKIIAEMIYKFAEKSLKVKSSEKVIDLTALMNDKNKEDITLELLKKIMNESLENAENVNEIKKNSKILEMIGYKVFTKRVAKKAIDKINSLLRGVLLNKQKNNNEINQDKFVEIIGNLKTAIENKNIKNADSVNNEIPEINSETNDKRGGSFAKLKSSFIYRYCSAWIIGWNIMRNVNSNNNVRQNDAENEEEHTR